MMWQLLLEKMQTKFNKGVKDIHFQANLLEVIMLPQIEILY